MAKLMSPQMRVELACSGVWEQLIGHILNIAGNASALKKILNGILLPLMYFLKWDIFKKNRKSLSLFHQKRIFTEGERKLTKLSK
jgi:hypothetical protein